MTVKQLITRLLDEPMDAEVQVQYPKEHEDEYGTTKGYLFEIDSVEHWGKMFLINFTDWRELEQEEEPQRPINIQAEVKDILLDELEQFMKDRQ